MIRGILKRRDLKTILINPRFQLDFIFRVLLLGLVNYGIFYAAFRYHFQSFYEAGATLQMAPGSYYFKFLDQQLEGFNSTFMVLSFGISTFMILGGIVLSHRVAGPLYRLRTHMDKVSRNETESPVSFRKKDYFHELATSFNQQMDSKKPKNKNSSAA